MTIKSGGDVKIEFLFILCDFFSDFDCDLFLRIMGYIGVDDVVAVI